ncbi:helix-turn-helix domain-containing protein [Stenotrophomonas sp. GD04024]|uniref:helix-turn-helix domain-containing protein n=1 Tax=Stenotrophomonas sp. GD04024 TaxID=2975422 RepID=UPI00244BC2AA|nr:helix-turn-helix domain-containing protein [Stenotrophomonas sp. GD04024]MDG9986856.1 helix-turn-helix domain-containing protein [Stenotrophomonas sp. GD04024]
MSGLVARWRLMMAAATDTRLHRSDIAVLAVILDRMDKAGQAWPSMSTIASDSGVSRGQVIKVLARLKELGYLTVNSGNQTRSNTYQLGRACRRPQEPTPSIVQEPTPRLPEEPGVDAYRTSGVDAPRRPEPALQATRTIEPEESRAADAVAPRKRAQGITFKEWAETVGPDDDLIPADHPANSYGGKVGLPAAFEDLAWAMFVSRHRDGGKRYEDWPGTFLRSLESNWYGLWRIDDDGQYQLTTAGKQAERRYCKGMAA